MTMRKTMKQLADEAIQRQNRIKHGDPRAVSTSRRGSSMSACGRQSYQEKGEAPTPMLIKADDGRYYQIEQQESYGEAPPSPPAYAMTGREIKFAGDQGTGFTINQTGLDSDPTYGTKPQTMGGTRRVVYNWKGLYDVGACDDTTALTCSAAEMQAQYCGQVAANASVALASPQVKLIKPDFPNGFRTKNTVMQLAHHVIAANQVPIIFQAVNLNGAGTLWGCGAWSSDPDFLSFGTLISFTREVALATEVLMTIGCAPGFSLGAGAFALPPVGFERNLALSRGAGATLQFKSYSTTGSVFLPWGFKADTAMDTAIYDLARATPIPPGAAHAWFQQLTPAAPLLGAVGFGFIMSSSSPLNAVFLEPATNNNRTTVDMVSLLVS